MPDTIIPFSDIVAQTKDNPVFRAAGISKPAPVEIPFSEIQKSESSSPEISLDQVANVDRFPRSTKEELFKDDSFDPRSYFNENPDIAQDPKQLEKLVEVYRARRERGVTLGAVGEAVKSAPSTAEKFVKGAANLASNVLEFSGVQPLINKGLGVLTGDAFDTKKSEALDKASQDRAKKAFSEFEAGSELSATGISDLGRTGARKIFGKSPSKMTHQELLADLAEDAAFQNQIKAVSEGRGESLKNAGLDADTLAKDGIVLDPQAIENLSLVDPATVLATAGGFKIVGALGKPLATAATRDAAAAVASKLNGLAETAVKKVGEGISKVGEVSQKAGAGATALRNNARGTATVLGATQVGAGSTLTGSGIIAASRLAPAALNFAGRQLTNVGEQIAGNAPRSGLIGKVLDISTSSPVKGAAAGGAVGAATAAPLALAADDDKAAGAILGGGLALGAAAGAGIGTARAIGEFASTKAFDPHGKSLPVVDSPAYGIDPGLDAIHTAQIEKLPVKDRGVVTNFREAVRNLGGEIYATDQGTFRQQLIDQAVRDLNRDLTAPELAQIDEASQHLGMFDANLPGGPNGSRRVVFLNDSAKAAPHEAGHLFESLVSPETRQGLYDAVKQFYTPEQISAFKTNYENRLGSKVTEERILGEIVAENFSAIFNNVPVTELTAPRGFLAKLGTTLAQGAEALGLDLTVGRTTPDLQAPASHQLREYFRNAATEVVKASDAAPPPPPNLTVLPPPPGGPTIPTGPSTPPVLRVLPPPTASAPAAPRAPARNIRVTQAQQDAFARRSADTGVPAAKELAARDADPAVAQRVTEISASMEAGNPVLEIEHLGIASESTPEALLGRTARRGEQAPGYAELEALRVENRANAPASVVNTHQKTFVPVRWTDQGGTPTLVAMSLDKVISNIHRIADAAADKNASSLLPYPSENGKLTEAGWTQAVADAQAYAENQSNGFRGDGRRLTRPTEDVGLSIPAENPEYRPQLLDENVANFQNLIQGLATPVTAREVKGLTPGNIKGQVLAEANKRPLLTPADITPKNAGKQNFKSFPGRSLKEVNPLRNELAARGVNVRDLIEVTERIRAKDIASVKPREDINFKAPVTDIIRAGFLPKENESIQDFGKRVIASSQEEWKRITEEGGSLTKSAYDIGLHDIKTPEDLAALKSLQQEVSTMAKQAIAEGDLDRGFPLVTKGQYFREAYEAATDTASAAGPNGWRKHFPNDIPPFKGGAPTASFLPKTKSGEALEKQGYEIKPFRNSAYRGVEIFDKNKNRVGEILASPVKEGEVRIANVQVKRPARGKGIGEALYRELGAQLKEDGVTTVTGDVGAPEPLGIRRKVFGEFSDLRVNGKSAPFEDAAAAAKLVQKGIEIHHIEPTNRITSDSQFLPAEELQSEQQPDLKIVPKSAGESPREIPAPLPVTARQPKETVAPNIKTPAQAANKKRQTESDKSLTISAKSPKGVAKASATPVKLTGWVLPNKEFVPLDTNFHEQYLADNAADLNKRFGTTFDTEANPDARLDALNSGFVRFRYDNNGTLHVEANASKWPRAKSKVLSQLVDNEGRIDRIQASLLNDKGQVVDSVNERVFDLEGTDKVAKITDSINSLRPRRGPAFLPKDELPGFETDTAAESPEQFLKEKTARFRKENPEAILPQYAHDENGKLALGSNGKPKPVAINYNFADTPLVKTAAKGLKGEARNAKAAEVLGDELVKVYNKAVKNPDIEAGSKWYSTARTRLRKVLGDDSKLFAELLGATSARTAVDVNFKFAVEAYNQFKSGAFDYILAKYREGKQAFDQGDIADFVKATGNEEPNRSQFLSWWIETHDLGPLQSNGKKFGMNSIPVLKVLDGSWASEVKGPKTPNFTGNLTGQTFEATVDVWAARLLHRLGNQGNEGRWRILPENETGVTDEDFYLGQAAFRHAAEKLGVKPDSLQAILWFAEKDFYEKAGWTRSTIGSGKTDFNVLLKRTEKTPSGKLKVTSEGGQKELIGPNFLPSGEYWMDSGGKFIKAAHGHLIEAEKILGVTNDSETARREVYPQMYAKGYTRIVSSQDGIYVDSEKARFSDLSSAQRAGIEDALLSNGPDAPLQELTFNGRRIEFDIP